MFGSRLDVGKIDKYLNPYGVEGWELVSAIAAHPSWGLDGGVVCLMKRCIITRDLKKHIKWVTN